MIPVRRQEQTEAEYLKELDNIIGSLQQMTKGDGWKRFAGQLSSELTGAWTRMANARTVDERAIAATEYMVLKRVLEAPDLVMKQAYETMMAKPEEKPKAPGRR